MDIASNINIKQKEIEKINDILKQNISLEYKDKLLNQKEKLLNEKNKLKKY